MIPNVAAGREPGIYLTVLWRRRWSILLVGALVVLAAYVYASRQAPVYQSQAEVLVRPIVLIPSDPSSSADVNMDDEQRVASSSVVVAQAAQRLGRPVDIHQVAIEPAATSHTLTFTASASTAQDARALAQAIASAYLDQRRQQGEKQLNAAFTPLNDLLGQLAAQRASLQRELTVTTDPAQRSLLQAQLGAQLSDEAGVRESLFKLVRPEQLRVGEILSPAPLPRAPATPNYRKTVAFALFVGLCLGVAVAFVRERLDDRVPGRQELETVMGVRVLVVPPSDPPRQRLRRRARRGAAARAEPAVGKVDARFTMLARHVLAAGFRQPLTTLLVTDTGVGEAASLVVANLGIALARIGKPVILLPTDLQAPKLCRHFWAPERDGAEPRPLEADVDEDAIEGVEDSGELASRSALRWHRYTYSLRQRLYMLLLPESVELLDRPTAEKLLIGAREIAELVLLDVPPVLSAPDAVALAGVADAVLLVVDAGRSTWSAVQATRQQLEQSGAEMIGVVLTGQGKARAAPRPTAE